MNQSEIDAHRVHAAAEMVVRDAEPTDHGEKLIVSEVYISGLYDALHQAKMPAQDDPEGRLRHAMEHARGALEAEHYGEAWACLDAELKA